jgi:argininosuccinate lyase
MEKKTIDQMRKKEELQLEIETNHSKMLEEKKLAIESRKKELEKQKKDLAREFTSDQMALLIEDERQRLATEQELQDRKGEIVQRKSQLERRRRALKQVEATQDTEIKVI